MANLYGSICLSDIPKELIITAQNGKKYLNIEVNEMQKPSQYGATHAVKASVKKTERKEGVNYYIGNLKPSKCGSNGNDAPAPQPRAIVDGTIETPINDSDLPF